jgi:hypothetical protein
MISPGCTFKILIKWYLLYWIKIAEKKIGIPELFEGNTYSAPSVYRPPFYRQPRLSPKFSSVPISPVILPNSATATGFQKQKS